MRLKRLRFLFCASDAPWSAGGGGLGGVGGGGGVDDHACAWNWPGCAEGAGDSDRRGSSCARGRGTCSLRRGGLTDTEESPFLGPPSWTPPNLSPFHGILGEAVLRSLSVDVRAYAHVHVC